MSKLCIVEPDVLIRRTLCFFSSAVGAQIDLFIFDNAPEPLDKHIVHSTSLAVHADLDFNRIQYTGEVIIGYLDAFVRSGDLRGNIVTYRFLIVRSHRNHSPSGHAHNTIALPAHGIGLGQAVVVKRLRGTDSN